MGTEDQSSGRCSGSGLYTPNNPSLTFGGVSGGSQQGDNPTTFITELTSIENASVNSQLNFEIQRSSPGEEETVLLSLDQDSHIGGYKFSLFQICKSLVSI